MCIQIIMYVITILYFPGHRYFTNPKPLDRIPKEKEKEKESASKDSEHESDHRKETERTSVSAV